MAAVCALWFPAVRAGRYSIPSWAALFVTAIIGGLVQGYLAWQAIPVLALFALIAYAATIPTTNRIVRIALLLATGYMALAMSQHKFAGFVQASLADNVRFSSDAPPMTHHASFDMISAGLILMAMFCNPAEKLAEWKDALRSVAPIIIGTLVIVLGIALVIGYVHWDFKLSSYTPIFLATNLLFTCVTEEAFFRGFMQEQLTRAMSGWRAGPLLALSVSALLFGIAHVKGGPLFVLLAAIAGLNYGYAYLKTRRIEASILTHFSLNAVHFIAFTYPNIIK